MDIITSKFLRELALIYSKDLKKRIQWFIAFQ